MELICIERVDLTNLFNRLIYQLLQCQLRRINRLQHWSRHWFDRWLLLGIGAVKVGLLLLGEELCSDFGELGALAV